MKRLKLYLDTSVISHLHTDDVPEKMTKTLRLWSKIIEREYETFISDLVIAEINDCPEPKKIVLEGMMQNAPLIKLDVDGEATELARRYIDEGIFPSRYFDDAVHVALASVFNCNVVVSWNFKHMVKIKTVLGVNGINKLMGYSDIQIVTPEVIVGEEDNEDE